MLDFETLKRDFANHGVVKLDAVLDEDRLAEAKACYEWSLNNKGPHGKGRGFLEAGSGSFEDKSNPGALPVYNTFLRHGPLAELAANLWGGEETWFMYEQVFRKMGGCRRTPWHQDSSYLAVDGPHQIVFWFNFSAIPKNESLEFIPGSHQGPLYNGSTFNIDDPTEPLYAEDQLPRLPDVDGSPGEWEIVSWAVEPGDLIAFHPQILHGGSATKDATRETLSLRFFGTDTTYAPRPGPCGPRIAGLHDNLNTGDPFRHPAFLKLR